MHSAALKELFAKWVIVQPCPSSLKHAHTYTVSGSTLLSGSSRLNAPTDFAPEREREQEDIISLLCWNERTGLSKHKTSPPAITLADTRWPLSNNQPKTGTPSIPVLNKQGLSTQLQFHPTPTSVWAAHVSFALLI